MATIGVRELREKATEVLRKVREEKAEYIITHQGRPVALLLPVDVEAIETAMLETAKKTGTGGWEIYQALADALRASWPTGIDTQAVLDEVRGD